MTPAPDPTPAVPDTTPAGRMFVLVVLCEVATIAGLWLLGRAFS